MTVRETEGRLDHDEKMVGGRECHARRDHCTLYCKYDISDTLQGYDSDDDVLAVKEEAKRNG
jgi:hypothetical protein